MDSSSIGFIGAGTMALALARGLQKSGVAPASLVGSDPRDSRREAFAEAGFRAVVTNAEVVDSDVVILATKPQAIEVVLPELRAALATRGSDPLVISIVAGVTLATLEGALPGARIVRAMPNTPLQIGAGATALAAGSRADEDAMALAVRLFSSVGIVETVNERLLDAVTGLSGSGPAFVFVIIEALADAGVKVGLHREQAQRLAAQTVLGSARLLIETGEHPGRLKDMVASPGGTTIAGLHTLESGGLRTTLIDAVEAAATRSAELGAQGN
ncbi:MAG: pyrroline-5-carboxylate reductase [Myxococcota bacterium]